MRSFLVAFAGLMLIATTAQAKVAITVDKDNQQMTVAVDGVERYRWPVSSGLPSYETPNGSFRAFRMEEDHYSKEFDDAPMPHSIFFTKIGHAIHGTDSVSRLGSPASHGCVRLSRANASTLYALVQEQGVLNTTVTLTGSSQQPGYAPQANNTPQPGYAPQPRRDDGYIYPADGTSTEQRYPAPRRAQVYPQQVYPPQQQYYDDRGYAPAAQGYYYQQQPRQYYQQQRGYYVY